MDTNKSRVLDPLEKRRLELIEEIISECEYDVTKEDIERTVTEIIIPQTLQEFWDRGLKSSATPRYFLWSVDYNLCVHFLTEAHTPIFVEKWPLEIGPEGETAPEYKAFIRKKFPYLCEPQPTKTEEKVESLKGGGGEASQSEAKERDV